MRSSIPRCASISEAKRAKVRLFGTTTALFEAALVQPALHTLQHACFLLTALLFWWGILETRTPGAARAGSATVGRTHHVGPAALAYLLAAPAVATRWLARGQNGTVPGIVAATRDDAQRTAAVGDETR